MSPDTRSCEGFRMRSQQCYVRVCQYIELGKPKDNYDMSGSIIVV
jgi:hypothetical protein